MDAFYGSLLTQFWNRNHGALRDSNELKPAWTNLLEIMLSEFIGDPEQLAAWMRVSKRSDPQAVRWVELPFQKLTANVLNFCELQKAGWNRKWAAYTTSRKLM